MSYQSNTIEVKTSNIPDTKIVTQVITNTHCIVCGKGFEKVRVGKLYCSNKCKQYGYNHKEEILTALNGKMDGIQKKQLTYYLPDFIFYDKSQKKLKRYLELNKKNKDWESADKELLERERLNLPSSNYLFDSYTSKKLTANEEAELYDLECELDERFLYLQPKELSIEQWSFIKSLYPSHDNISFFEITSSLSRDFISQLNTRESENRRDEFSVIKNKFLNHCNLIAIGCIEFKINEDDLVVNSKEES